MDRETWNTQATGKFPTPRIKYVNYSRWMGAQSVTEPQSHLRDRIYAYRQNGRIGDLYELCLDLARGVETFWEGGDCDNQEKSS